MTYQVAVRLSTSSWARWPGVRRKVAKAELETTLVPSCRGHTRISSYTIVTYMQRTQVNYLMFLFPTNYWVSTVCQIWFQTWLEKQKIIHFLLIRNLLYSGSCLTQSINSIISSKYYSKKMLIIAKNLSFYWFLIRVTFLAELEKKAFLIKKCSMAYSNTLLTIEIHIFWFIIK